MVGPRGRDIAVAGRLCALALAGCTSSLPSGSLDAGRDEDGAAPRIDGGADASAPIEYGDLDFAGLESIDSVGSDSMRLLWPDLEEAAGYRILQVYPSGKTNRLADVAAGTTKHTLFGLEAQTEYTLRVNALDAMERIDRNEADITVTTGSSPLPNTLGNLFARYSAGAESASDGVAIATWSDISGNDRDASQGTATQRPIFVADAIGGRPALEFDGVDDLLASGVAPTNAFTVVALARSDSVHQIDIESSGGTGGTAGQSYLFGALHGGASDAGVGLSIGTNGLSAYEHGSSYMPAVAVHDGEVTGWNIITLTYTDDQARIYLNGQLMRTGVASPRANAMAPSQFGGGSYGSIDGAVAEVLVYSGVLDGAARATLRDYLDAWYSL